MFDIFVIAIVMAILMAGLSMITFVYACVMALINSTGSDFKTSFKEVWKTL